MIILLVLTIHTQLSLISVVASNSLYDQQIRNLCMARQRQIVSGTLLHSIHAQEGMALSSGHSHFSLTQRESEFLKLVATELTYKEIADKLRVSPRTVDGYRDDLFEKLMIRSRVGLVIYAIKNGIVKV